MKKMHAISGNKQFMTKRAIPLLKKYGIQKSRANLIGGQTLELRFLIDDDKLERINKELKKMNRTAYDGISEQLRKMVREELLKESQDIDKMADEIVTGASYYARKIRNYISLDGDVWGGMSNGQEKYEAMQKLLTQMNKELDKFGKTWITKYERSVDKIKKS